MIVITGVVAAASQDLDFTLKFELTQTRFMGRLNPSLNLGNLGTRCGGMKNWMTREIQRQDPPFPCYVGKETSHATTMTSRRPDV